MRPAPTYTDPVSPSRQEGQKKASLPRAGAALGNWNDRTNGGHVAINSIGQSRFERPLRWHAIDRIAGRLYTLPERRPT